MPRTVSLVIDGIASGGDGVARSDGLVVFVPRTAPGDVITATISGKGHFARGTLRTVTRPSPDRVDPSCPHYTRDRCGGCQLQHLTYAAQLGAKQRIIADAITRIGKRVVAQPSITPSRNEWRYRSKLTLAIRRRGAGWIAGLHPYDDPGHVFPLADCPIADRRVVTTWREILDASSLFPDAPTLRGSVRWTAEGPTFVLSGGTHWRARDEFFAAVPTLAAAYWEPQERAREVVGDRRARATPAASFAQINAEVAGTLRAFVRERVLSFRPATVIDAYSGAGDLAAEIAATGVAVTAIELDPDAARWAEQILAPPSRSITGRVEDVMPRLHPADVVVVNPPRAGLHEHVTTELEGDHASRAIVYVSCDPATLARDIARLPSYDIASLDAFDMFPQTSHVETVCVLTPQSASA